MKKNKSMRAAGGLMIATMLTTSIVSGTYAKYVTSDSATDTARVAKFGVTVAASGSLFDTTYMSSEGGNNPGGKDAADTNDTTLTVESSTADKLLAPGTKNDKGLTFSITGTPEVDVNLVISVDTYEEIFLKKTETTLYPDMTTGDKSDTFNLEADYYPVTFTLTQTKNGTTTALAEDKQLSEIKTTLQGLSKRYDANKNLANEVGTLNLTWEWAFEQGQDQADTLLGDLAAGTVNGIDAANYNLNTNIELTVSVTQVD